MQTTEQPLGGTAAWRSLHFPLLMKLSIMSLLDMRRRRFPVSRTNFREEETKKPQKNQDFAAKVHMPAVGMCCYISKRCLSFQTLRFHHLINASLTKNI